MDLTNAIGKNTVWDWGIEQILPGNEQWSKSSTVGFIRGFNPHLIGDIPFWKLKALLTNHYYDRLADFDAQKASQVR